MPPANETPQQMRKRLTAAYTTAMESSPFARRYGGINPFSSPKVSIPPPTSRNLPPFMNGGAKKTSSKTSSKKKPQKK
jgi:hypothetical protein